MRLMECVRLRVKDVDFARTEIVVREGKGGKDRMNSAAADPSQPDQGAPSARSGSFESSEERYFHYSSVIPSANELARIAPYACSWNGGHGHPIAIGGSGAHSPSCSNTTAGSR